MIKIIKKGVHISLRITGIFLLLLFICYQVFRSSSVQTRLVNFVSNQLFELGGVDVEIKGVDVNIFKGFVFEDVFISDHNKDTLFYTKEISLSLSDYELASNTYIIKDVSIYKPYLNLIKYEDEELFNLTLFLNQFKRSNKSDEDRFFQIEIEALAIEGSRFKIDDRNSLTNNIGNFDLNHLFISELDILFNNISIYPDSINLDIKNLKFEEHNRFNLLSFKGGFSLTSNEVGIRNLRLLTENSVLKGDVKMNYGQIDDFRDFIHKIHLNVGFDNSKLDLSDVGYFSKAISNLSGIVDIKGKFEGNISNLRSKSFELKYGKKSTISGGFTISGLPEIKNTFFFFDNIELLTNKQDIETLPKPPFTKVSTLRLPDKIGRLGNMKFYGKYTGFLNDFAVDGFLQSDLGNLKANLSFLLDSISGKSEYKGQLSVDKFDVGKFYKVTNVGELTMNGSIKGSGLSVDDALVSLDAHVDEFLVNAYQYKDISISGKIAKEYFDGNLIVQDDNISLKFYGSIDVSKEIPDYYFDARLEEANLKALNLSLKDREEKLRFHLKTSLSGSNIDNINGLVTLDDVCFKADNDSVLMKELQFYAASKNDFHDLSIRSDFADVNIKGVFRKDNLFKSIKGVLHNVLPSYFETEFLPENQDFEYYLSLHNTSKLSKLVFPDLIFNKPITIEGKYVSKDTSIVSRLSCDELKVFGLNMEKFNLECAANKDVLTFNTDLHSLNFDSLGLENLNFEGKLVDDNLQYEFSWKNNDTLDFYGGFDGLVFFSSDSSLDMSFLNGKIVVDSTLWTIDSDNQLLILGDIIRLGNFKLNNGEQSVGLNGGISRHRGDKLNFLFENLDLTLLNRLISKYNFNVSGRLDGKASISDIYSIPQITAGLNFYDLNINGDSLGDGILYSDWIDKEKLIEAKGKFGDILNFSGWYKPYNKNDNVNANLFLKDLDIQFLEELSSGVVTDVLGDLSGELSLTGNILSPNIKGELSLSEGELKVEYLNTVYRFPEEIVIIENDWIGFDILEIVDERGNKALATGTIVHDNFKDMNFDINIVPQNFMCLNTNSSDNPDYYGEAYISGMVNISGYADQLIMDINVNTEKGTRLNIPLESTDEVSALDYIKFLTKDTLKVQEDDYEVDLKGVQLNFDLDVTQETEVQIIFDEQMGDVIKARGSGDMSMEINTSGNFSLYGDYEIAEGEYLFTLQNLLNKKFTLEPGGVISWSGDPYNGMMNIDALYSLRAPLKDLAMPGIDTTGKRVPVKCRLNLSDAILKPNIEFDLLLPSLRDDEEAIIKSSIESNGSMNKEVFALLLLNRFVPITEGGIGSMSGAGGKSTTEVLSNQLSNWLSKISDDFDVGLNYRPGDEVSSREVEIALSTQLFNDRVAVETNLGMVGNSGQTQNSLAGDFKIEYKISKDGKFRGKVYNESNDATDISANNAKYTQGAGLFYQEEFESFRDLLGKLFVRKKD